MRFSKLLVLVVAIVTTSIVFLNCSLVCVATDCCRKYDICIGNVFDHMFVDGSFKSVSVVCSPVNPSQYPFLYDFGFVNRYTCNTYLDKFNGNSYIFGEFSAAELQNDTSSLSSYCYFTVSLFCAIGDFKGVHSTIDNFILNSSITCGSSTTVITYDSAVEYVTYDGIDIGIYTFGFLWVPDLRQFIITVDCSATDVSHRRELSSTKTVSGVRKILLSRSHSLKLQFYIAYRGISGSDYLCQTSNGFLTGNQLMYHFKRALSALNLPNIRFHDLRHSYATLMLKNGVNPKIVSSVLGHSDVSTTLNIYSHYDYTMQEACLDILDDL